MCVFVLMIGAVTGAYASNSQQMNKEPPDEYKPSLDYLELAYGHYSYVSDVLENLMGCKVVMQIPFTRF